MWRGCCPHRTLERSAKQMAGSLIRDQALVMGEWVGEGRRHSVLGGWEPGGWGKMMNSDEFTVLRVFQGDVQHQRDIGVWEAAACVGRMASRAGSS